MNAPPLPAEVHHRLATAEGVLFDIDGCLVLFGQTPHDSIALPGAAAAITALRASGRAVAAFTNASAKTPAGIAAALHELGIPLDEHEILTPAAVAAEVITSRYADRPVLAFGGPGLLDVLHARGTALLDEDADPTDAAAVVVGWDTNFHRDRLQRAAEALWNGAELLTTSDAPSFASRGRPTAGVSGFIAHGLAHVTGAQVEILGKPSPTAMEMAARKLGVDHGKLLVVGDDLTLEIRMALAAGATAVLTTTGTHSATDAAAAPRATRPDLVVDGLPELLALWPEVDEADGGGL
ncbi:HAD-IIA family hydrolase [Salinactinospora qingdaonensis]|uniref:HAD-IIA family hydrolase n=1 Tax=Salinactinospora qingdaonensis TaxID=702744 RepID=A0ABP7F6J4_9ACTN